MDACSLDPLRAAPRPRAPAGSLDADLAGKLVLLESGQVLVLADVPGLVLSRKELLRCLPGDGIDEHAVEMAVTRLRSLLGDTRLVQTVVKRGYRLAHVPEGMH